jgi:N-acetyl-gamma-glutamyl-phosphate/LysW-gamma-L-alpha-aminoadipyl-6-phosphate reductase
MAVRVAVVGASGYTGGELLRILALHPDVEVTLATSEKYVGKPLHFVHFNLRKIYTRLRFTKFNIDEVSEKADAVFLSLPHGISLKYVPKLLELGLKVIDLSADFRLKDPEEYKRWYGFEHPYPDILAKSVYGLPELHRDEIRGAQLVAVPGCNATAAILALAPLVRGDAIDTSKVIADIKAGSSERGMKPSLGSHHPEREGSIRPYEAEGHRHVAEVVQEMRRLAGREVEVSLVPHAVSSIRGVLASVHAWLVKSLSDWDILKLYVDMYSREPFVRIVRGVPPGYPDPKYVIGSNYADVGFAVERRTSPERITAFSAIDNLVKGAAGQAVQDFNIMMGFRETAGLELPPLKPA